MPTVLLTGATGYIASHTWLSLLGAGFAVVGIDDFSNSAPEVLNRLRRLSGAEPVFERLDVRDGPAVERVLAEHAVDAVVHFAAYKAVGESTARPLDYYDNNVGGLVSLCQAMRRRGCPRLVFSSSATVYGDPESLPIREDAPLSAVNPYGETKLVGEGLVRAMGAADPGWHAAILRYFNPVGAHESGLIGEDPRGTPNNLMPYVAQVAIGRRPRLQVFGADYPTPDGTGVRDYIHVEDLGNAHLKALDYLRSGGESQTLNCGYGHGYSVREVISMVDQLNGQPIKVIEVPRRAGDPPSLIARAERIRQVLGWIPQHNDLAAIVKSQLAWERRLLEQPGLQKN
jgi:UDP-glucose 4-epimerase